MVALSSGFTYYLVPKGNTRTCLSGWMLEQSGSYEGKYSCGARSGVYYDCVNIKGSSKVDGYYCNEGVRVSIEKEYLPGETQYVDRFVETPVYVDKPCPNIRVLKYYEGEKYICDGIGPSAICKNFKELMG